MPSPRLNVERRDPWARTWVAGRLHLQRWRDRFEKVLPAPPGSPLFRDGFEGDSTPYLDAIELLDLIVPPRCLGLAKEEAPS